MPVPPIDTKALNALRDQTHDIDVQIAALVEQRDQLRREATTLLTERWAGDFDLNDPETFRAAATDRQHLLDLYYVIDEHYQQFSPLVLGTDGLYAASRNPIPIPRILAAVRKRTAEDLRGVRALAAFITKVWDIPADTDPDLLPLRDGMVLMSTVGANFAGDVCLYLHPTQDKALARLTNGEGERVVYTGTLEGAFDALVAGDER